MTGRVTSTGRVHKRTGVLVGWDDDYVCRPDHYALCRRNFLDYHDVTVGVSCVGSSRMTCDATCAPGPVGAAVRDTRITIEARWPFRSKPAQTARMRNGDVLTLAVPPPPPGYVPVEPPRMTVEMLIRHIQKLDPALPVVLIGDADLSGPVTRKHVVAGVILDLETDGVTSKMLAITPEDSALFECFGRKKL